MNSRALVALLYSFPTELSSQVLIEESSTFACASIDFLTPEDLAEINRAWLYMYKDL